MATVNDPIEISTKLEYTFPNANPSLSYCRSVADIIQEISNALKYSSWFLRNLDHPLHKRW